MSLFFNISPAFFAQVVLAQYLISYSLRFDGTGDYLTFTPSSTTDRQTFTVSAWVKRGSTGTAQYILGAYSSFTDTGWFSFFFNGDNNLRCGSLYSGHWISTTGTYTNTSEWLHVVLSMDVPNEQVRLFVNGAEPATTGTTPPTSHTFPVNTAGVAMTVGRHNYQGGSSYFDGQIAELHFIDGTAYDASYFGETRDGVWVPKEVTDVTYGNNGFYLDFAGNDTGVTLLLDGSSKTADVTGLPTISATTGITETTASPDAYDVTEGDVLESTDNNQEITASGTNLFTLNEDFTLEAWVKIDSESTNNTLFRIGGNMSYASLIGHAPSSGTWVLYLPNANDNGWSTSAVTLFTGVSADSGWHHIAFTKSGTTFRGFVDGVQTSADIVNATTFPIGNGDLRIGVSGTLGYGIDGQWQDIRYTKGIARDIAADWTAGVYTSALTNTPEYLGDFGVDRTTNSNDFSVEGNITADDQLLDTPNLRFATLDPDAYSQAGLTISEGNLQISNGANTNWRGVRSDFSIPDNGKVYYEWVNPTGDELTMVGVTTSTQLPSQNTWYPGYDSNSWGAFQYSYSNFDMGWYHDAQNSTPHVEHTDANYTVPAYAVGMVAVDRSTGKIHYGIDGQWWTSTTTLGSFQAYTPNNNFTNIPNTGALYPAIGSIYAASNYYGGVLNFGQDHTFAGAKPALVTPYSDSKGNGEFYYQPPEGFLALVTEYK